MHHNSDKETYLLKGTLSKETEHRCYETTVNLMLNDSNLHDRDARHRIASLFIAITYL